MLYEEVNQYYKFCIVIGQVPLLILTHRDFFSDTFLLKHPAWNSSMALTALSSPDYYYMTFWLLISQPYFSSLAHTFYVLITQILYLERFCVFFSPTGLTSKSQICILKLENSYLLSFWFVLLIASWTFLHTCSMDNQIGLIVTFIPTSTLTALLSWVSPVSFITSPFTIFQDRNLPFLLTSHYNRLVCHSVSLIHLFLSIFFFTGYPHLAHIIFCLLMQQPPNCFF